MEWAKSRARAHRFTEEVLLLTEEMLRVPTFLQWKSDDWKAKAKATSSELPRMRAEGLTAYAERQAAFYSELRLYFKSLWIGVPKHVLRMQEVIEDPSKLLPGELDKKKDSRD